MPLPKNCPRPKLEEIVSAVCHVCRVSVADMMGKGRGEEITAARRLYFYVARQETLSSFPEIVRAIGKVGHSTAIDGSREYARFIAAENEKAVAALAAVEHVLVHTMKQSNREWLGGAALGAAI